LVDKFTLLVEHLAQNPFYRYVKAYLRDVMKESRRLFFVVFLLCSLSCASYSFLQFHSNSATLTEQGTAPATKAASDLTTTTVVLSRAARSVQRLLTR
jgi:hypothetical protein